MLSLTAVKGSGSCHMATASIEEALVSSEQNSVRQANLFEPPNVNLCMSNYNVPGLLNPYKHTNVFVCLFYIIYNVKQKCCISPKKMTKRKYTLYHF